MSQLCRSVQYTYRFKTCSGEICNGSIQFRGRNEKSAIVLWYTFFKM